MIFSNRNAQRLAVWPVRDCEELSEAKPLLAITRVMCSAFIHSKSRF
jgi:hypothetical protein